MLERTREIPRMIDRVNEAMRGCAEVPLDPSAGFSATEYAIRDLALLVTLRSELVKHDRDAESARSSLLSRADWAVKTRKLDNENVVNQKERLAERQTTEG